MYLRIRHQPINCSYSNLTLHPTQQPILLQGHERAITRVKFNSDGDLLFTCAKDHHPTVWNAYTGERIGTYEGHKGAIWDIDPTCQ